MINFDEKYICAYLCNKSLINDFNILLNFYNEVARVSLKTKDIHFMQIRLQWFIDAVADLYKNKKSGFPLVDNLLDIIKKYDLEQNSLIKIIESRNIDKDYVPFKSIEEYIKYCQNTGGIFWRLIMQVYGGNKQEQEAAYLSGTAFALLGNIRNISFNNKRMHYNLVFNKNIVVKGGSLLDKEVQNNIKLLLLIVKDYISKAKAIKIRGKYKRLLLLNVFCEGYKHNIKKSLNNIKALDPYKFSFIYKIKFVLKYIFG